MYHDQEREKAFTRRRALKGLAVSAGAGGLMALGAASPALASAAPVDPAARRGGMVRRNLKNFGAVGDGKHDDTAALAAALTTSGPVELYVPAGRYLIKSFPKVEGGTWNANHSTIVGDGAWESVFVGMDETPMLEWTQVQDVKFERLTFEVVHPKGTAAILHECFTISFLSCRFQGQLLPDNQDEYIDQTGLVLTDNTGSTSIINTGIFNFGVGLKSTCIQNYFTGGKFATNRVAILGTGNTGNAGLQITMTDFVGYDQGGILAEAGIRVEGKANQWAVNQCWFEKNQIALDIGDENGGPVQFGVSNTFLNASETVIRLRSCQNTTIDSVSLFGDSQDTVPMTLDKAHAPLGCFSGALVWTGREEGEQVPIDVFPSTWQVHNRHYARNPVQMTDAAVVLGDDGRYWKLSVDRKGHVSAKRTDPSKTFGNRLPKSRPGAPKS